MKKKGKVKRSGKRISNNKLLFLSVILLFIVFEALYMLKGSIETHQQQVAGVSTQKVAK